MASRAGRHVGAYRLVRCCGQGGMSQVWLAERADGQYEQRVAVKLAREADDMTVAASRIRAEREILASLDHPNIAKLLDGGVTDDGLSYLVMEFVDGEPIDQHCRTRQVALARRLELMRTVCAAVHYAHRQGVVHRDLKPANILVTHDGMVKLVDFGIAGPGASGAATTRRAMTLAHASPEQVRGERITPASDTYSLGVVLYQLLAGAAPYPANASDYELVRAICETEPPPPSAVAERARRRELRGDLDAIVAMAMRKDPAQRYPSADALSDDLFRRLEGLPVRARKGAWSYRAGRFVLRHKAVLGAVLLANAALLVGVAVASYEAYEARMQRLEAERQFASVRRLATMLAFDVDDLIRELPGSTPARKLAVENATRYLRQLGDDASGDATLQVEIAAGYRKIGDILGLPDVANLGDIQGANASYDKARALLSPLLADPKRLSAAQLRAAQQEQMRLCQHQGTLLTSTGRFADAAVLLETGLRVASSIGGQSPSSADDQYVVALAVAQLGRLKLRADDVPAYLTLADRSARMFQDLLRQWPDHQGAARSLALHYLSRGEYLLSNDDPKHPAAAQEPFEQAIELLNSLRSRDPDSTMLAFNLAIGYDSLGLAYQRTSDFERAAGQHRRALEMLGVLVAKDPSSASFKFDQATAYSNLGAALLAVDDVAGSARALDTALGVIARFPAGSEDTSRVRFQRGQAHFRSGQTFMKLGKPETACAHYALALTDLRVLEKELGPSELNPATIREAMGHCRGG